MVSTIAVLCFMKGCDQYALRKFMIYHLNYQYYKKEVVFLCSQRMKGR